MDSRTRSRSTGTRGAATRDALVQATVRLVERDGLQAVTTRAVAAEADLPHGTVHYWFTDKRELLEAALAVMLREVRAAITADDSIDDIAARLRAVQRRFAGIPVGRQIGLFELTLYAARSPEARPLANEQYLAYSAATEAGMARWREQIEATLPGGSPALATLVVAVMDGLCLAELSSGDQAPLVAARELFIRLLTSALPTAGTVPLPPR